MTNTTTTSSAEARLEKAVGELYAALYQMHEIGMYQEEYDSMGTIINMLVEDRQHFRQMYGNKINA
jgi:hypothetical protein